MKQLFPFCEDPAEHEQWLETQPLSEPVCEHDYEFIDRLFERLEEIK